MFKFQKIIELNECFGLEEDSELRRVLYSTSVKKKEIAALVFQASFGEGGGGRKEASKKDLIEMLLTYRRHPAWRSIRLFAKEADTGTLAAVAVGSSECGARGSN